MKYYGSILLFLIGTLPIYSDPLYLTGDILHPQEPSSTVELSKCSMNYSYREKRMEAEYIFSGEGKREETLLQFSIPRITLAEMGPYEEENLPADVESIRESFHVEINGIPLAKEKIEISYVYLAEYPGHWLCNVTISFTAPLDGETKIVNSWPQELPVMAPGQPFMYNEFIIYMESISYWKGGRIGEFHLNIELPEDNPFDYTVQEDSAYDARMEDETLFKREGFFHENWCVKGSLRLDRENYSSQENFEVTLIDQYYSICYESLPWIDMPATSQKGWASSVYLILWVPVEEIKRERDWTAEEARFLVNLLFAWHGYRFQSDEWDSHFALYDWYEPCFESQEEARELFSPVELANLEYLLSLKN